MELSKGIKAVDLCVLVGKTLIVSDIHIGYEEALNKQGILIPRFQFKEVINRFTKILDRVKPEQVIINGDLKHEFGRISDQEWRDSLKILALIERYTKDIILIKGNHDTILGPIADKKNIKLVDKFEFNKEDICVTHGHKVVKTGKKTVIIGHEHPAIRLREKSKFEMFKCFLKGSYGKGKEKKTIIVQPSFNQVTEGTDVLSQRILSPYLKQNLDNFEAFIVGEEFEVLEFGKLRKMMDR